MSTGKTTRYPWRAIILLLVLVVAAVACQPGGEEADEPVTITMVAGSVGKEFEVLQEQVAAFEAQHPDIRVELIELPESATDRHAAYVERLERGDPTIDVYMIDIIWPPEFGEKGWTVPLDAYVAAHSIDMDDFLVGTVQGNTWEGELVSMPWFTDAGLLYYRQDLLTKYGFEVPKTWSELATVARAIVAGEAEATPDMAGFVFQGKAYEGLVCNYLEHVWGNGAAVLSENGDRVVLDSPEAVAALDTMADLRAIAPPGIATFIEEDALNYFRSGNAVFLRSWPYAWAVLNSAPPETYPSLQGKVGIAPLPHGPGRSQGVSTLGGWQLGISAYSQHPDEAFEFIAFLTSLEQQVYKAVHAGQNPTRLAAYEDEALLAANPHMGELFDVVVSARPRPVHPRYPEISAVIQRHVHSVLTDEEDAAAATEVMAAEIQQIVAGGE